MQVVEMVCWQDKDMWLGYLQDYPDYWSQGETVVELKQHLHELYQDITQGRLAGIHQEDNELFHDGR